jgi:hypothetical protein
MTVSYDTPPATGPPDQHPRKSWPARHKIWTALGAAFSLFVVLVIVGAATASPKTSLTGSTASTTSPSPAAAPAATSTTAQPAATGPLPCHAAMSISRPAGHTTDLLEIRTASRAQVTTVAHYTTASRKTTGRSGSHGRLSLPLYIAGNAARRHKVTITVTVMSGLRSGRCSTSYTPRVIRHAAPPPSATPSSAPPPAPSHTRPPPPPPRALSCGASMSSSSPADYTDDYVDVTTMPYAGVTTVASYKTTSTQHTGQADGSGNATIDYYISDATVGYTVPVSVTVTARGRTATCSTSFTPSSR